MNFAAKLKAISDEKQPTHVPNPETVENVIRYVEKKCERVAKNGKYHVFPFRGLRMNINDATKKAVLNHFEESGLKVRMAKHPEACKLEWH